MIRSYGEAGDDDGKVDWDADRWEAGGFGHALVDRQLYLPKDWTEAEARRKKAHVPEDLPFATKPAIARRTSQCATEMIARTLRRI